MDSHGSYFAQHASTVRLAALHPAASARLFQLSAQLVEDSHVNRRSEVVDTGR